MNLLIVIPARGGSKGIPRKNLRPVGGKPMIYYSITSSLHVNIENVNVDVVVSTDDEEIGLFSERFGAEVIYRNEKLSGDAATLDPVVKDAYLMSQKKFERNYQFVCTVQPTSPLVTNVDIENSFRILVDTDADTVISVVGDRHLCWGIENNKPVPRYKERINRQQLPQNFKETGAVVICSAEQINNNNSRIGELVAIYEMPFERSFDIDNYADLSVCEAMLSRKRIVFTVVGYPKVGLGHAYRALMLAHELVQYDIAFVIEQSSKLAANYIETHNYTVHLVDDGDVLSKIEELTPDLVINDILDTERQYMQCLKGHGYKIVNFEDLGDGAQHADLVINALYPHQKSSKNVLVGETYFCLRDEFLYLGRIKKRSQTSILVTFGGVDEGDITTKALLELLTLENYSELFFDIVVGPGYQNYEGLVRKLDEFPKLNYSLTRQTNRISEHMKKADVAITSGGRTVLELSSLKIPTIVVCQNEREMSHSFASLKNGVLNLGLSEDLIEGKIAESVNLLISDDDYRLELINKMERLDLSKGKERVITKIKSLLI